METRYVELSKAALLNLAIYNGDIDVEAYMRLARKLFPPPHPASWQHPLTPHPPLLASRRDSR